LCCCGDLNETVCINRVWTQQETKCVCTWATSVLLHFADNGEVPQMKHLLLHTWPQERAPNPYKLRTIGQLCCTHIHWHFPSNTIPSTDRQTVNFRSNCILHKYYPMQCTVFHCTLLPLKVPKIIYVFVTTASNSRVGNVVITYKGTDTFSVDVTFKTMTFLYRDSPSVTSTDEVSEPTQAVRQYK
jgi:hypothetical protein